MGDAADSLWSAVTDRLDERELFLHAVERECRQVREACDYDLRPDDDGLLTCRTCGKQFDYP